MFFSSQRSGSRIVCTIVGEKYRELMLYCYISKLNLEYYINYSFTLFRWMLLQVKEGRTIVALDEKTGGYVELDIPPFKVIRDKRARGEL